MLSPGHAGGKRAGLLFRPEARFDLAVSLREASVAVGALYTFVSGLYFRGKLAYVEAFAAPPEGLHAAYVIVPGRGLLPPHTPFTLEDFRKTADISIDLLEARYREPLTRDARSLAGAAGPECEFVLLGSVATPKYIEPLGEIFGSQLLFPKEFVGRGDMSRGGLMLRCSASGNELEYVAVAGATLRGRRPAKLPKVGRSQDR